MSNEVTVARSGMPFSEMERLGEYIAKSNLFGIRTKEQAIVLMAIAQAEGRHPVEAARDYDIVNNRPAKKAEAMMRDFIKVGGTVKWHSLTDELADATFTHPQTGEVRIDWDMKRAQTAFGKKDMYAKFPRQMLRSRVVSEGVRTLWPLATSGMLELGEASAIQPEHNGPTLEATPEREAINDAVPLKPAAAATPRGERKVDPTVYETPPKSTASPDRSDAQWRVWLDKLKAACEVLYHRSEVVEVAERPSVADALGNGPEWVRREISAILAENYKRFPAEDEPTEEELGEVEIEGAEKMASG
jgi:hypothetical protein